MIISGYKEIFFEIDGERYGTRWGFPGTPIVDNENDDEEIIDEIVVDLSNPLASGHFIRTKEEIVNSIKEIENDGGFFCGKKLEKKFKSLLVDFRKELETKDFFDAPDGWAFAITINASEIQIELERINCILISARGEVLSTNSGARYCVLTYKFPNLSIEEYSKEIGVSEITVRQWIRRGKIRSAYKEGRDWVIPALSAVQKGKYHIANYEWIEKIDDLPKKYEFINDYTLATFMKADIPYKYEIVFQKKHSNKESKSIICEANEREIIEMIFIANKNVKYYEGEILYYEGK